MFCRKLPAAGEARKLLESLDDEDMCELLVGRRSSWAEARDFLKLPGAAGYTTGRLLGKRNPKCLPGGRGLQVFRLQRVSAVTRSGKVKGVEPAMSAMKYFPKVMTGFSLGNPEKQPCIYQFATSFPAGLSLAQSWNLPLAEAVGEAVGKEMEAYGVTYWLAPALNIHRKSSVRTKF